MNPASIQFIFTSSTSMPIGSVIKVLQFGVINDICLGWSVRRRWNYSSSFIIFLLFEFHISLQFFFFIRTKVVHSCKSEVVREVLMIIIV